MKYLYQTLNFIVRHPLNKGNVCGTLWRWFKWQIFSLIFRKPHIVPFFNGTKLLVSRGMTGATGNIYCGLHEFETMGFLIHLLRKDDVFVDVGANIGSYSILSASLGAKCFAFEPIPQTYQHFLKNIHLNHYELMIKAFNIPITDDNKPITMTSEFDTANCIINDLDEARKYNTIVVQGKTLDDALLEVHPIAIKIDAEGFERQVIQGGEQVFSHQALIAAIVEMNQEATHEILIKMGFLSYTYDPLKKQLRELGGINKDQPNTLYLRNLSSVIERIKSSPQFRILDQVI